MTSNSNIAYLALEERPNSFIPIDLTTLDIFEIENNPLEINRIDSFTKRFSLAEIKDAIKRANIVDVEKMEAPLVVFYKHKLPVLTKEVANHTFTSIISQVFEDKQLANKYYNKFNSLIEKVNLKDNSAFSDLKNALTDLNMNQVLECFLALPYSLQRELFFYMVDAVEEQKLSIDKELKRIKKES